MCDEFFTFFTNKIVNISAKIRDMIAHGTLLKMTTKPVHAMPECLGLFDVITVQEATRVILNLPGKSFPLDFVPVSILKGCVDAFMPLIARLANLSFYEGCFLDMFKFGQIRPLLKEPRTSTSDMSNFRPITNLNTIGKILERLAMKQLRRHNDQSPNLGHLQLAYRALYSTETAMTKVDQSPNLGHLQSAYRALHSTETAMTKVVSDLLSAVDSGEPSAPPFLDISAVRPPSSFVVCFGVTYHQYADDTHDNQAELIRQVGGSVCMCRCSNQLASGERSTRQPQQNGGNHNWYQTAKRQIQLVGWRCGRRI